MPAGTWRGWLYTGCLTLLAVALTWGYGGGERELVKIVDPVVAVTLACFALAAHAGQRGDAQATGFATMASAIICAAVVVPLPLPLVALLICGIRASAAWTGQWPWSRRDTSAQTMILAAVLARMALDGASRALPALPGELSMTIGLILAALVFAVTSHLFRWSEPWLARGDILHRELFTSRQAALTGGAIICLAPVLAVVWDHAPFLAVAMVAVAMFFWESHNMSITQVDGRTGLSTKRYFRRFLDQEMHRSLRFDRSLTIMVADIDGLRAINTAYGRTAGDTVLAGVAATIRAHLRAYDVAAHDGGDSFLILLPETSAALAAGIAERLRGEVAAATFAVATSMQPITATITLGVAAFPEHGADAATVIRRAKARLAQAKSAGAATVNPAGLIDEAAAPATPPAPEAGDPLTVAAPAVSRAVGPPMVAAPAQPATTRMADTTTRAIPTAVQRAFGQAPAEDAESEPAATVEMPPARQVEPAGAAPPPLEPAAIHPLIARHRDVFLYAYVGLVVAVGLFLQFGFLGNIDLKQDFGWIILLTALGALAEAFPINIYGTGEISFGFGAVFVLLLLYGMPGLSLAMWAMFLARGFRHPLRLRPVAFNAANWYISAAMAAIVLHVAAVPVKFDHALELIPVAALAALTFYVVNMLLLAEYLSLLDGIPFKTLLHESFGWMLAHHLVLAVLYLQAALAFADYQFFGLLAYVAPPLMIRYAVKQYLDRTTKNVTELRLLNAELRETNHQLESANEQVAGMNRQLLGMNSQLLRTLARTIDIRDPFVLGHSFKVSDYAMAIATAMGLEPEYVELVQQAGLVHDIGKIGIADEVLHKQDKLTDEEFDYIKTHPALGSSLLKDCPQLEDIAEVIRHHHEKYDGTGYPDRLAGDRISLAARIIGLSDAVDAMASDRPHKRGMPPDAILVELRRCAGTHFDPDVVEAFSRIAFHDGFITNSGRDVASRQTDDVSARFGVRHIMQQMVAASASVSAPVIISDHPTPEPADVTVN